MPTEGEEGEGALLDRTDLGAVVGKTDGAAVGNTVGETAADDGVRVGTTGNTVGAAVAGGKYGKSSSMSKLHEWVIVDSNRRTSR